MNLTEEELSDIRWLAELVRAQGLSEKKAIDREYVGYSDRGWMQPRLDAYGAKVARCDRVLAALDRLTKD